MSFGQAGARCGGQPGCWGFLRGTLGITAWTCVCVCARPEALCTTRVCVYRLGFVKLYPRPLCVCLPERWCARVGGVPAPGRVLGGAVLGVLKLCVRNQLYPFLGCEYQCGLRDLWVTLRGFPRLWVLLVEKVPGVVDVAPGCVFQILLDCGENWRVTGTVGGAVNTGPPHLCQFVSACVWGDWACPCVTGGYL